VHPALFHIGSILIPSYGAVAAVGVLLSLLLAQRTARLAGVDPAQVWNLCVVALFAAIAGQRLLLVVANWSDLERHPAWMLTLAMVHHPLLAAVGVFAGAVAAALYGRWRKLPLWATADTLAAPLALGLAFEQLGALLAGSGFGIEASAKLPWAVTYSSVLAARWSGTPLGIPLQPVQAYAALAFLMLATVVFLWMQGRRQAGDAAGICLMGVGTILFLTESWRDPAGRGLILHDALDAPQIAGVLLVLAGGVVLRDRKGNT
jgi:phosphatidylglycerol---prolipoprotein diacylglyceryl transferase